MGLYRVLVTQLPDEKAKMLEKSVQEWIKQTEKKLEENPHTGKPIGFVWFREKKFGKYRLYFLIYEDLKAVFVVNLSEKKDQQKIINSIILHREEYRLEVIRFLQSSSEPSELDLF